MNLDDDLAAWAATVRLPAADADAIFARIVASPFESPALAAAPRTDPVPELDPAPPLDPAWWRGFTAGFTTRMVAATAPVRLAA
ncbi:MAG: hypothetical protein ABSA02_07155 [Trebonia sp.]|jgi:hypothetical protein